MMEMPESWDTCQEKLLTGVQPAQVKKYVAVNKAERSCRSEKCFDIRHEGAELEFAQLVFRLDLVQYPNLCFLPYVLEL